MRAPIVDALRALSDALAAQGAVDRVVIELPLREFTALAYEARAYRPQPAMASGHPLLPIIVEGRPEIRVVLAAADRERLLDFAVPRT